MDVLTLVFNRSLVASTKILMKNVGDRGCTTNRRYKGGLSSILSRSNAFHCCINSNISLKIKGIVQGTEQTN